jgi:hypothetical protein
MRKRREIDQLQSEVESLRHQLFELCAEHKSLREAYDELAEQVAAELGWVLYTSDWCGAPRRLMFKNARTLVRRSDNFFGEEVKDE